MHTHFELWLHDGRVDVTKWLPMGKKDKLRPHEDVVDCVDRIALELTCDSGDDNERRPTLRLYNVNAGRTTKQEDYVAGLTVPLEAETMRALRDYLGFLLEHMECPG